MGIFYIDGNFVDEDEAVLPVTDLAILRGYAVFDFLRTYNGRPFHLEAHLRRLRNSAALIGLDCHWSLDELTEIVDETLARNNYPESNIRLLITGGDSEDSISPGQHPRLLVMVRPVTPYPENWYEEGIKIITARLNRYIPGAKSTDYIRAIVTLKDAEAAGAIESVYVNKDDYSSFWFMSWSSSTGLADRAEGGIYDPALLLSSASLFTASIAVLERQRCCCWGWRVYTTQNI